MKKSFSFLAMLAMVSLAGCGSTGEGANDDLEEILDLQGEWQQVDSDEEDAYMYATIEADSIVVDWTFEDDPDLAVFDDDGDGIVTAVYWEGSYEAPTEAIQSHSWVSEANTDALETALFASTDDSKEFAYDDGVLSFDVTIQDETATVEMEQVTEGTSNGSSGEDAESEPSSE